LQLSREYLHIAIRYSQLKNGVANYSVSQTLS